MEKRPQLIADATVRIPMMNVGIAVFLGVLAVGQDADRASVLAEEQARIEVIRRVTPSVVCLFAKDAGAGGGSGVLIDSEGYGLTNFHVVASMLKDRVGEAGLANGKRVEMQVLGIDPHGDVAMFRLMNGGPFSPAVFGDADSLQVGDSCLALGNPFLLAEDYTPTVTFGIVSGLHRYQWGTGRALSYTDCIQVDTSINPGNSGGPLFDMEGRLVGINGRVSIEERGRVNVGVGYAITINQIRRFIPALRAGLTTPHGAAGFTVADATRKIVVNQILKDSAAHRAGLRVGDHLTRFGGVPLRSANHFLSQLGTYPANWLVDLVYEREGQTLRTAFRLDTLPLPETRRRPGSKAPDPYASNKLTRAANRRATKRLFDLVAKANGGRDALKAVGAVHATGVRRLADTPQDSGTAIDVTERRADALRQSETSEQMERRIRWTLWRDAADADAARGSINGCDEVGGRAAAVVRREFGEADEDNEATTQSAAESKAGYRLWLDDADGRLLAMEFADPVTGKLMRYEYADEKRCGPLKLGLRRTVSEDGRVVHDEVFEKAEVSETAR